MVITVSLSPLLYLGFSILFYLHCHILVPLFDLLFLVADALVEYLENHEEWCDEHEEEVVEEGGGPLLEHSVSDELSHPGEQVQIEHPVEVRDAQEREVQGLVVVQVVGYEELS